MEALTQGFAVDQLQHCLQTATRAERGGADLDMIVASLCHDIGKTISNANHPAIAAEMIRPWVSPEAYWVVKVHQDFQGLHYYARMGLDPMMRRKHEGHPAYDLAAKFADEWDQTAFDPDYDTLPLEHFEPMVREVFGRRPVVATTDRPSRLAAGLVGALVAPEADLGTPRVAERRVAGTELRPLLLLPQHRGAHRHGVAPGTPAARRPSRRPAALDRSSVPPNGGCRGWA